MPRGPIAIAGVIGGRDSAISDATTSIVLESANFNASSVRKTSAALKLRTDASMRFEKAQDPHNTVRALARALELLPLISPGIRLVGGLADRARRIRMPAPIELNLDWLARKLGRALDAAEVRAYSREPGFGVSETGPRTFSVTFPLARDQRHRHARRSGGRSGPHDRLRFDPPTPPLVPCAPSYDPPEREFLRTVRRAGRAQGFTRGFELFVHQRGRRAAVRLRGRKTTSAC